MDISLTKNSLVDSVNIKIDGITVLCGENGCRKKDVLDEVKNKLLNVTSDMNVIDFNFIHMLDVVAFSDIPYFADKITEPVSGYEMSRDELVMKMFIIREIEKICGKKIHKDVNLMDDMIYDCSDSGLGIFLFLLLCLENGHLSKDTVIFMDNMSGNMHPVSTVELARTLVKLNKLIGCKFVGTSNIPDFVSAIQEISGAEDISSNVNFYLGEKNKDNDTYHYRECGNNIEYIFDSFNRALDLISIYGG